MKVVLTRWICTVSLALLPGATVANSAASALPEAGPSVQSQASASGSDADTAPLGTVFPADTLRTLLPATVYFQGKTAPLQLRNAAGTSFGKDAVVWASLVDSSGYSTAVQERYQFYLVTESALQFGSLHLPPGAYGGGYLGDHFLIMDLGGHTIGEGPVQSDATLARPRPMQMIADQPTSVRLYLGRRWVLLRTADRSSP